MAAEKLNTETVCIIGKYYLVPCAIVKSGTTTHVVPVIGEKHKDPQFGVKYEHYHIDGRFTNGSGRKHRYDTSADGYTNGIVPLEDYGYLGSLSQFQGIEIRKRKCKRLTTGIIPPDRGEYIEWYSSYVGKSCAGKKCPHLGTQMLEYNNQLVCPLHNLKGCLKTELIIPINQ